MIKKYSDIQQNQFLKQNHPDSQDVFFKILTSKGSYIQLLSSFKKQSHKSFIIDNTSSCTIHFDGIILINTDVELMSTTLAYFANALHEGYDFIYCDAVYGGTSSTDVLFPDKYNRELKTNFAVISASIFEKIKAHSSPVNISEMIQYASEIAVNPYHIKLSLLNYRKPLTSESIFSTSKKMLWFFATNLS